MNTLRMAAMAALWAVGAAASPPAQSPGPWRFAVSGDSRNCGDVVMPAIAAGVAAHNAEFYWHLGDFRAIYDFDQDYRQTHTGRGATIIAYETNAWQDFIDSQLSFFGAMPVYLGIGNHEIIPPKTRTDFIVQFADWLAAPSIRERRLADNPADHGVRSWYHWVRDGVDFINLDNASLDQFDSKQLAWAETRIDRAAADPSIRALVIGMHEALPGSLASNHSMDDALVPRTSGTALYDHILAMHRQSKKPVYLLASHSHFYMANIFNTPANRARDGVLPGWIVGTAGAERYALPPEAGEASAAETNVYGYVVATVEPEGNDPIHIEFVRLDESDIPAATARAFTPEFVHACFTGNSQAPR